jgi:predicted nucleic-acid-binding protein
MKALDSNMLVRFLVRDDAEQAHQVYELFKQVESQQQQLFVPLLVVFESIRVLQAVYGVADAEIIAALNDLLLMPVLVFEAPSALHEFVISATSKKVDLADLLIACSARQQHCRQVLTFDKNAAKLEGFELI